MNQEHELIRNLDRLHTTESGIKRIRDHLALRADLDVISWCRDQIRDKEAIIAKNGKNWYISTERCIITVNASSYTIITAHKNRD